MSDDTESAESFAARLRGPWVTEETRREIAVATRERDAAIRRATLIATADAIQKRADEQASGTLLRSELARLARDIRAVAKAEAARGDSDGGI